MYQKSKTLHTTKEKTNCEPDGLLVLSFKNLPQCTVDDLRVICTIHHFVYIKNLKRKKLKTPPFMLSVTLLAVLVKYKKIDHLYKNRVYIPCFGLIHCTITSVVYTSYTSVLLRLRLYEPKHILIPTHVEVEILQQAHTVGVKTVSCL